MNYIEFQDDLSNSLNDKLLQNEDELEDKDLKKIYKFHFYKGYNNIITLELVNFFSTIFMVFFILVLVKCIDYSGLSSIDNNSNSYLWDYIDLKKIVSNSFLDICFIVILSLYLILRIFTLIEDIRSYKKTKILLKEKLNISSYDILFLEWSDLVKKIEERYNLNTYQIHSRILRVENIMINIFDSELNKFLFSKLMEWNLTYLIYNIISKHININEISVDNYIEESQFLENENTYLNRKKQRLTFNFKNEIRKRMVKGFLALSIITFIFMPFLFIYVFFFTFLKYGERYYNNPIKITFRQWCVRSNWKQRYYNELSNDLNLRLDVSSKYAKEFLDFNKSKVYQTIIKFLVLILSSIFIMFLILSIYNENILLNLHITKDKHVLWYLGLLGSIIAIGRNLYKTKKINNTDKESSFKKLLIYNPLLYNENKIIYGNRSECGTLILEDKRRKDKNKSNLIKKSFVYQIYALFLECFSVLIVPFTLIYICNYIDSIIETFEKNLYYDENDLGFISKDANFKNINKNSRHKSLLSFKEFRKKFPEWGKNIEIYQIGSLSFLNKPIEFKNETNFPQSIFEETFNSDISII